MEAMLITTIQMALWFEPMPLVLGLGLELIQVQLMLLRSDNIRIVFLRYMSILVSLHKVLRFFHNTVELKDWMPILARSDLELLGLGLGSEQLLKPVYL